MGLYLDEGNPIPGSASMLAPYLLSVMCSCVCFVHKQYIQELNCLRAALRLHCSLCSQYGIHTYIIHQCYVNIRIGLPQSPH